MRVGLEVHQQLDTSEKLFCGCPTQLVDGGADYVFMRQLWASRSELGEVDAAAHFEESRKRVFLYEGVHRANCLVEMDEEPPHPLNREALELALMCAKLLGAKPVDEVEVMRKLVIDGSNTSGFQRTALIARGGTLKINNKEIGISTICLEEDAARIVGEEGETTVRYRLDRLGIPLIEISTQPDIASPQEAEEVALKLGGVLRRLRRVKRGLGTIRQDVNVSIEGGARIEVKGVQELGLIAKITAFEAERQAGLIKLSDELKSKLSQIKTGEITDVSEAFSRTGSKIVSNALSKGNCVLGVKIEGFRGYFGFQIARGRRFGTELADYAKQMVGVGGLFHSDELPAYGISNEEVNSIRLKLNCCDNDGFVLVVSDKPKAKAALQVVTARCKQAIIGVVEETRSPQADGTTKFSRPIPGAARMYPETDVPYIRVEKKLLDELEQKIPPPLEDTVSRLIELKVSPEMARQALNSEWLPLLEKILEKHPEAAGLACGLLVQDIKEMSREGIKTNDLSDKVAMSLVERVAREGLDRQLAKEVLKVFLNKKVDLDTAFKEVETSSITPSDLHTIINAVLSENSDLVAAKGEEAFKALMGEVMKRVRGKVAGSVVSRELANELRLRIQTKKASVEQ
jgi:glutamyl-tRNA(Gln) amidotransferase subunit E